MNQATSPPPGNGSSFCSAPTTSLANSWVRTRAQLHGANAARVRWEREGGGDLDALVGACIPLLGAALDGTAQFSGPASKYADSLAGVCVCDSRQNVGPRRPPELCDHLCGSDSSEATRLTLVAAYPWKRPSTLEQPSRLHAVRRHLASVH